MSYSFELEIKHALDGLSSEDPAELRQVAQNLMTSLESNPDNMLSVEAVTDLSRFFVRAGLYGELILFITRHFHDDAFPLPWPYFLDAIQGAGGELEPELADALLAGIDATSSRSSACRSRALDFRSPSMRQERADRRLNALKAARQRKESLLEQLVTLRTQQLYEQERQVLEKLQKMFPRDPEVLQEVRSHKERYALEILAKHSRLSRTFRFEENSRDADLEKHKAEVSAALQEAASENPALALDLAIAAAMLDLWEVALSLLEYSEDSVQARWLRLELLLAAGRHIELLQELARVELLHADDPETFFATAYLRAQALWGLGQKHSAIEVMESLLASRPHYRSGLSLLSLWREK